MTKVIFKDKKSLQSAKSRTRGVVNYRQMKDGRIIAVKWPKKEGSKNDIIKQCLLILLKTKHPVT